MSRTKKIIWSILGSKVGLALIVRPTWKLHAWFYWRKPPLEIDLPHRLLLFRPEIRDGKKILSIHLNNRRFLELQKSGIKAAELSQLAKEDLGVALASLYTVGFEYFYFQSVHRRLMQDWGMEIRELPESFNLMFEQFYAEGFVALYHPRGAARLLEGVPKIAEGRISR
jgi:hypothetical protein